jgi:pimeloyl-ACP methyl ester carboxylesterase
MVLLHGFMETWRSWELVLPVLERRHDVLALTLAGHAGGPPIEGEASDVPLVDAAARAMDEAGFATAHLVGNSLGGYVAFGLAARDRARTVVALAPAGGWDDDAYKSLLGMQSELLGQMRAAAPHVEAVLATPEGRRRATRLLTVAYEHIPAELLAHELLAGAQCHNAAMAMIARGLQGGWDIDAERVACPVRIVWGTEDRILPWPSAAARYRRDWFPHADWVELEGVGHAPQLDVPLETAQLILGFA